MSTCEHSMPGIPAAIGSGRLDFLQTIAPYFRQQIAIGGKCGTQSLGVLRGLVHFHPCQRSVTLVQQPGDSGSLKSHPIENVLVARRREHFFTMREVFMPGTMVAPEFEGFVQAVRNRVASSVVDPESGVGPAAQHVVK